MTESPDQSPESEAGSDQLSIADERFPELAELEDEIQRRIKTNQRFLERFMDEDFEDEDFGEEEDETPPEDFEEP
jgi:hypothetical protein